MTTIYCGDFEYSDTLLGKLLVGCEVATFEARIIVDLVAWIIPRNVFVNAK